MDYESTPDFEANFLKLTSKNKALEVRFLAPAPFRDYGRHRSHVA